ncbi:MAG: hypothetical protein IKX61_03945 [Prevotella sp.]|nr:hypothetical protein [Prevotella sp.]
MQNFCSLTYNVTFPLFDKINVNGENESPLYIYQVVLVQHIIK